MEIKGLSADIFEEEQLFTWLKAYAESHNLLQARRALIYASKMHRGQLRKYERFSQKVTPYIVHPMIMARQAICFGLTEDRILTVVLLHDVCEDCGVEVDDLPFEEDVRRCVGLLTRSFDEKIPKTERDRKYYEGIRTDAVACIVKGLDRCNNVSTMALSYPAERLVEYIGETEQYILPMLHDLAANWPEYENASFALRYHICSVLETAKFMVKNGS